MEVQEVVKQSIKTFGDVFPGELQRDLRLEEIRLSDDEAVWSTTLSFRNIDKPESDETVSQASNLEALFGVRRPRLRAYKTVRLRASDGKLLGIVNGD